MFQKIDDWLFDNRVIGFQILANRWQTLTGFSCFWLARRASLTAAIALFLALLFLWDGIVPIVATGIVGTIFGVVHVLTTENLVRAIERATKEYTLNILRILPIARDLRLWLFLITISLVILPILIGDPPFWMTSFWMTVLFALFAFVEIYFAACTPLPPQKSKVRKWLEKLLARSAKQEPISAPAQTI